jgi:hypothetical protein
MALDASVITQIALGKYKAKMAAAFPDVVKGGTVEKVPKEDGTFEYNLEEQRGPMEIDEKGVLPLLESLAEAVVEHLKSSGEIPDTTTGPNIGRIL